MGFKPVSIVALVFVVIAFLFSLIALASPYWTTGSGDSHNGLWKVCNAFGACSNYGTDVQSWFNWIRFFMFAEMFLLLAAAIMVGVAFARETKVLGIVAVICMLLGGGCGMVAMALYTDKRNIGSWGWAYGLGWAAWLFAWIAAGLSAKSTTDL